ncbi:hypothetical protein QCA50_006488 [Cerrena zonata]|uniref:Non-specific serine/threonine protein kinase n=1 Tax=Cerrena zonata TaxID=2478898 RepID=A0AAW0GDQ9_9APHY
MLYIYCKELEPDHYVVPFTTPNLQILHDIRVALIEDSYYKRWFSNPVKHWRFEFFFWPLDVENEPLATLPDRLKAYEQTPSLPPITRVADLSGRVILCLSQEFQDSLNTPPTLESFSKLTLSPSQAIKEARNKSNLDGELASSPSFVANSPSTYAKEQVAYPIFNGQPANRQGPPVTLFSPVLATLNDRLEQIHNSTPVSPPSATLLKDTTTLFEAATRIYDNKNQCLEAMREPLQRVLDLKLTEQAAAGDHTTLTDGAIKIVLDSGLSALIGYLKCSPETGVGGDPGLQASLSFRKHVTSKAYESISNVSACPCILIGISGTQITILTGIFIDRVVVQPLIKLNLLNRRTNPDEHVAYMARVFAAIANSFKELRQEYREIIPSDGIDYQYMFPKPSLSDGQSLPSDLRYLSLLGYDERPSDNFHQTIYSGELDGKPVVIKFTDSYNANAHRMLAEYGFAPTLHFYASVCGGHHMIIMDKVQGRTAHSTFLRRPVPLPIKERVEKAIGLLHQSDLVFGDLRRGNIMVTEDESVMLVDFDWVGEEYVARYPETLNLDVDWPDDVQPGGLMTKEHDYLMLERL